MRLRRPYLDLDGAVVVVTGGSSGIGKATALRLADRGARLVLAARGEPALARASDDCRARGAEVLAVPTDVSDEQAVAALARRAEETFGRIDAWINDAGVMAYGTYDEVPMATHRHVVETNLLGPMYGAMEAIRRFRAQDGRGVLVNVASLYAEMTSPLVSSYVTSKFALLGFSRVLRRDLHGTDDIAVCCILPASIDTPIFRNAGNHFGRATRAIPPVSDPERVARAIVGCLERPRKEVRIGTVGRLMAKGEVIAPPLYDRLVGPAFRMLGFTGADVAPHDGNVFEPSRDWKRVDGGWRNRAARRTATGVAAAVGVLAGAAALARRAD